MAEHVYPFGVYCRYADQCSEDRCVCGDMGHFCPIECVTCAAACGEGGDAKSLGVPVFPVEHWLRGGLR